MSISSWLVLPAKKGIYEGIVMTCHWNDCCEMTDGEMVVIHSPATLILGSTLLIINDSYTTNRRLIDVHQDTDMFIIFFNANVLNPWTSTFFLTMSVQKIFWIDMAAYCHWIRSVKCYMSNHLQITNNGEFRFQNVYTSSTTIYIHWYSIVSLLWICKHFDSVHWFRLIHLAHDWFVEKVRYPCL